jgi:flagellar M-ring protein FliF
MADGMQQLITNLRDMPPGRQAVLAITTLASLGFFLWLSLGLTANEYRPLYRGVDSEEAASITEALRDERFDYKLDEGGTTILVPADVLHEARIRIAGRGLPGGAGVGLELFDTPAFGVSDFVHRINFVRAIQGELARTIEQLEPVERARVQVVIPERRSVLAAAERKPSASVVVALRNGWSLEPGQVQAVVHLVASSIEDLAPKQVTIVDAAGQLLAPSTDERPGSLAAASGVGSSYQARLEQDLSGRVERILEKTLGQGNVVARVRADLEWTESETTEESFDPDGQVARSEQRSTEEESDVAGDGGVAGAIANLPSGPEAAATPPEGSLASRTTETINYEISKTVRRSVTPMGAVKRLSIAVLVADRPGEGADSAPVPWPAADLDLFESLARQAVGFDEKRGDEITVRSAPFRVPEVATPADGFSFTGWLPLASIAVRGLLLIGALVLFAKLVVKPVIDAVPEPVPALPARVDELDSELGAAAALAAGAAGGALHAPAGPNPEDGAKALRNWLSEA